MHAGSTASANISMLRPEHLPRRSNCLSNVRPLLMSEKTSGPDRVLAARKFCRHAQSHVQHPARCKQLWLRIWLRSISQTLRQARRYDKPPARSGCIRYNRQANSQKWMCTIQNGQNRMDRNILDTSRLKLLHARRDRRHRDRRRTSLAVNHTHLLRLKAVLRK